MQQKKRKGTVNENRSARKERLKRRRNEKRLITPEKRLTTNMRKKRWNAHQPDTFSNQSPETISNPNEKKYYTKRSANQIKHKWNI